MDVPDVSYARSGDVAIAYQVVGEGADRPRVRAQHARRRASRPGRGCGSEIEFEGRGAHELKGVPGDYTAGDGFLATFDGPARAIRCATAIQGGMPRIGLEVRAGVHTGECELFADKVAGVAVHTGARVLGYAGPGEVLVSQTVKDLVAGSGIEFADRGAHELKGVSGEWRLYAVSG